MCGFVAAQGDIDIAPLLAALRHRGPDDSGIARFGDTSLGHRRLSIIDIAGGHQPLANEDGTIHIVFNGEIYNYQKLRSMLGGHVFSTRTDTEVILHLYEEKGTDCVLDLDGMFAFAIYDFRNDSLFLARDRLGIKPLYYGMVGDACVFASEIKALVHCDRISEFPPGTRYTTHGGFERYYTLPSSASGIGDEAVCIDTIRELLSAAVKKRMVADVPVGVFLSGGLDSSIIAALMKQYTPDLHSFAVGMEGSSDLVHAREAAAFIGTIHHEYIYTAEEMIRVLPAVMYHLESFDAPLVRSAIPCYFVSRLANSCGVKVVLAGEGADELFSGYNYLKDIAGEILSWELIRITDALHHTNLQRVDRMTMAHSVEARVPFLDIAFLQFVFSIPLAMKAAEGKQEKWLLRQAFRDMLPVSIIERPKLKFSAGAGSMHEIETLAERTISDHVFKKETAALPSRCRTKEELYYYRIFREHFPAKTLGCVGKTEVF